MICFIVNKHSLLFFETNFQKAHAAICTFCISGQYHMQHQSFGAAPRLFSFALFCARKKDFDLFS